MSRSLNLLILIACGLFATAALSVPVRTKLDPMLVKAGIKACASVSIRRLGELERHGHRFTLFQHQWDWNNGNRQTRRLLVFRDGKWLGHVSNNGQQCKVSGHQLTCNDPPYDSSVIPFGRKGPPKQILIGGAFETFDRSPWAYNIVCEGK